MMGKYKAELLERESKLQKKIKKLEAEVYKKQPINDSWMVKRKELNNVTIDLKTVSSRIDKLNRKNIKEEVSIEFSNYKNF